MIDLGIHGKGAVVSGAGEIVTRAGHGRQVSLRLAEAGAHVACIDINEDRANDTVAAVKSAGGRAFAIVADMTDRPQVERAIRSAADKLGSIDICVDIIGGARWDSAVAMTQTDWEWTIRNNLTQAFDLFQVVGAQMIAQGTGGSIVALSSVDGIAAAAIHSAYGAAKAGLMSLAKTFAHELGRYGIRVNTVAPGNVGTGNEGWPEGEWATNGINPLAPPRTRDIANALLFLCSSLSERITGQTLVVDGGATIKELWGISEEHLPAMRGLSE